MSFLINLKPEIAVSSSLAAIVTLGMFAPGNQGRAFSCVLVCHYNGILERLHFRFLSHSDNCSRRCDRYHSLCGSGELSSVQYGVRHESLPPRESGGDRAFSRFYFHLAALIPVSSLRWNMSVQKWFVSNWQSIRRRLDEARVALYVHIVSIHQINL